MRLGEPSEDDAEQRMPPRRLRERATVREERGNTRGTAAWVVPVDEAAERIEGEVLAQRHPEGEPARIDRDAAAQLVERQPEEGAVRDVDRETRRPPVPAGGHCLAEDRDVRVVAAEEPSVEGFLERPHRRGSGARNGRPRAPGHHRPHDELRHRGLEAAARETAAGVRRRSAVGLDRDVDRLVVAGAGQAELEID